MKTFSVQSRSLADTQRVGRALGEVAEPGLVVGLVGQLGAGKTAFTRAVAEGLRISNPRLVTSPTFVLIQEYPARLPIYHFDAYRLPNSAQFADLGVDEYFEGDGICLVEWADMVEDVLPTDRLEVRFTLEAENQRSLECRCYAPRWEKLFIEWQRRSGATLASLD